jgi:hypothetical protein
MPRKQKSLTLSWSESQVPANSRRGKHELPAPVGCRIGILPFECRRKSHAAETF